MSTVKQVYTALKNDEAFRKARRDQNYNDMQLILRAYGYKHTVTHAFAILDYGNDFIESMRLTNRTPVGG